MRGIYDGRDYLISPSFKIVRCKVIFDIRGAKKKEEPCLKDAKLAISNWKQFWKKKLFLMPLKE